ncbi:MAG: phosphotransferase, partial [Myxococcota bacterium]
MAVYTHLNAGQIARYAGWFGFTADRFRGVPGGTINTIYALSSGKKKYILRLLENRSRTDALFEDALLCHLRAQGLSVPIMLNSSRYGRVVSLDARQHLSIFEWMPGREIAPFELQPQHTEQVGRYIGKLHRATPSLRRRRRNRFSPQHIDRKLSVCERFVRKAGSREMVKDAQILRRELERFQWPERLPAGIVHSDLFVDNA